MQAKIIDRTSRQHKLHLHTKNHVDLKTFQLIHFVKNICQKNEIEKYNK